MDVAIIVLALVCIANILLGLFVLLRNTHSKTARSFFAMALIIDLYAISNYLTDNAPSLALSSLFNRLSYLTAFLALAVTVLFTRYFVGWKERSSPLLNYLELTAAVAISLFSLTKYVAGEVDGYQGNYSFTTGSLNLIYNLILLFLLVAIVRYLYTFYKNGDTNQKKQAMIIAGGFSASILVAMLTNAVIPALSSDYWSAKFGPTLLSLILVSSISYAIVRHKLFDIRPLVARSFAYLFTLASLAVAYVIIVFGVARNLFTGSVLGTGQEIFFVIFTLFAALTFQPIKRFFDRITNHIFYRDAYDSQTVLNQLNSVLTRQIALKTITNECLKIICQNLKISHGYFAVLEGNSIYELAEYGSHSNIDIYPVVNQIETNQNVVVADELESGHNKELLEKYGLSVSLRLVTGKGVIGYILLKPKISGNVYSSQDIRLLTIISEELAIAVENSRSFDEIARFNVTLQQKIREATIELTNANVKLVQMDKTKDEFISMASHQLRTPLTTIKGYLSMVMDGDTGPVNDKQKDMMQKAFDSAQKMVYLIADMLNVSRLQTGKFIIENKPTDLVKLVDEEVAQLQSTAEQHKLNLVYHKPESFPTLNIDENKIRQVVMNFLDNAIFYTPSGGSITADLNVTGKEAIFTVTDTGLGVPASVQHHLFSKFYRADNARKMRPDGTGLGLFMAKKVITAQGGAIIFKSTEGKGSTFGFSIPLQTVQIPPTKGVKEPEKKLVKQA